MTGYSDIEILSGDYSVEAGVPVDSVEVFGDDDDLPTSDNPRYEAAVFGDDVGADGPSYDAVHRILMEAQDQRRPPGMVTVLGVEELVSRQAHGDWSWVEVGSVPDFGDEEDNAPAGRTYEIIGKQDMAEIIGKQDFAEIIGEASHYVEIIGMVRLDTEESYVDYLGERAATMEERVDALEHELAAHEADPYAHVMGADIPLSLPPWAEGKVRCWREGDELLCSMRLPGPDGKVRIATTSTSLNGSAAEVCGYAMCAGVDAVDMLGAVPVLSEMLGAGGLLPRLAAAAPALLSRSEAYNGEAFVGVIVGRR